MDREEEEGRGEALGTLGICVGGSCYLLARSHVYVMCRRRLVVHESTEFMMASYSRWILGMKHRSGRREVDERGSATFKDYARLSARGRG